MECIRDGKTLKDVTHAALKCITTQTSRCSQLPEGLFGKA